MDTSDGSAGNDPLAASFNDLGTGSGTGQGWEMDRSLVGQFLARSPVGMAVMSPELRYIWINEALERLGGVPREERLGKRLGDVLPKLDAEQIEATMRGVLETGEPAVDIEYRGRTQADPEREHAYSTSFFRLDDTLGRVRGVCYMVIDVTDRWRAGSRLALLNEVGARTGKSLNLLHIAQGLAESCVPDLADFVAVDLLDPVLLGEAPAPDLWRVRSSCAARVCAPPSRTCGSRSRRTGRAWSSRRPHRASGACLTARHTSALSWTTRRAGGSPRSRTVPRTIRALAGFL